MKLIDQEKDPVREPSNTKIDESNFPPCVAEKGTFLSPNEYSRPLIHKWKGINRLFDGFRPGVFHHKPYSFNAVPYLWMMKSTANPNYDYDPHDRPHKSKKALEFEVDYKPELEAEVARVETEITNRGEGIIDEARERMRAEILDRRHEP